MGGKVGISNNFMRQYVEPYPNSLLKNPSLFFLPRDLLVAVTSRQSLPPHLHGAILDPERAKRTNA
jgi:hypothetical protein